MVGAPALRANDYPGTRRKHCVSPSFCPAPPALDQGKAKFPFFFQPDPKKSRGSSSPAAQPLHCDRLCHLRSTRAQHRCGLTVRGARSSVLFTTGRGTPSSTSGTCGRATPAAPSTALLLVPSGSHPHPPALPGDKLPISLIAPQHNLFPLLLSLSLSPFLHPPFFSALQSKPSSSGSFP